MDIIVEGTTRAVSYDRGSDVGGGDERCGGDGDGEAMYCGGHGDSSKW